MLNKTEMLGMFCSDLEAKLFSNNHEEGEADDDDDDMEDEHSYDKDEEMSDDSEQNIDLLEN